MAGAIDYPRLTRTLADSYGLSVTAISPMPGGYTAACHAVDAVDGRYVLKVFPAGAPSAALAVMRSLRRTGLRVPYPIPTRTGDLVASGPSGVVGLFPFLDGVTPPHWPEWTADVLEQLGRCLGQAHSLSASLIDPLPPVDDFDLSFVSALPGVLERALSIDIGAELYDELTPLREEYVDQLERLRALRASATRGGGAMVLCHTDAAGDNVLVSDDGTIAVLDWDDVVIAPPECDFALIARDQPSSGTPLADVLRGYRQGWLPRIDRLAFFMLRRYLADTAVRVDRALDRRTSPDGRREALDGIIEWGVRPWRRLDDALEPITAMQPVESRQHEPRVDRRSA